MSMTPLNRAVAVATLAAAAATGGTNLTALANARAYQPTAITQKKHREHAAQTHPNFRVIAYTKKGP